MFVFFRRSMKVIPIQKCLNERMFISLYEFKDTMNENGDVVLNHNYQMYMSMLRSCSIYSSVIEQDFSDMEVRRILVGVLRQPSSFDDLTNIEREAVMQFYMKRIVMYSNKMNSRRRSSVSVRLSSTY